MEALPNKTRARAEEILTLHLRHIEACCFDTVQAVVLTGSLVTGSYTGDAGSDIDLVHILRDDVPDTARADVLACIARTEADTACDLPIARCVYRLRELYPPYPADFPMTRDSKDYLELPIELLRIKDAARVIWGEADLASVPVPTREAVIASRVKSAEWARQLAASGVPMPPRENLPIRLMSQSVLVTALLDVFFATGCSCSDKSAVASRIRRDVPDYAFLPLVEACARWRYRPDAFTVEDEAFIRAQWPLWQAAREKLPIGGVPRHGMI